MLFHAAMEDCCYTGSHLDLFELAGAPLCMPLLGSNLTNDVDLGAGPIENLCPMNSYVL